MNTDEHGKRGVTNHTNTQNTRKKVENKNVYVYLCFRMKWTLSKVAIRRCVK